MSRHECAKSSSDGRKDFWHKCALCDGRIHLEGCTSKRDPKKDCCKQRHMDFITKGQTVGLYDSSQPMLNTWSET